MTPPMRRVREHYHRQGLGLRRTAVHEAGHAAMAILLGCRLDRVSVRERVGGHLIESGRAFTLSRTPSAHVLVMVAGAAAERIYFGDGTQPTFDDLREAQKVAQAPQGVVLFGRAAKELLRLHWAGVMAIALALEEHATLQGSEARDAFYEAQMPDVQKKRARRRRRPRKGTSEVVVAEMRAKAEVEAT